MVRRRPQQQHPPQRPPPQQPPKQQTNDLMSLLGNDSNNMEAPKRPSTGLLAEPSPNSNRPQGPPPSMPHSQQSSMGGGFNEQVEKREKDIEFLRNVQQSQQDQLNHVQGQNSALQNRLAVLDQQYEELQLQINTQKDLLAKEVKRNQELWAEYEAKQSNTYQGRQSLKVTMDERLVNGGVGTDQGNSGYEMQRQPSMGGGSYSGGHAQDTGYADYSTGMGSQVKEASPPNDYGGFNF